MKNKKYMKKVIIRIFVFLLVGAILISTFWFLWESSRPETLSFEIISPRSGNVDNVVTITGNIEPRNLTAIKPEIPGIISRISKKAGDQVKQGDIIATLRIIPDAGQLSMAESRLRTARISWRQISAHYARQKELFENNVISRNEYEVAEATYYKAMEELENAQESLEIASTGSSRNSHINNTHIRANASGRILDIPVKEGDRVIQSNVFYDGTTIAVIADMSDLIFKGTIDETDVGRIRENMPVSISVGAIPNEPLQGVLEYISLQGTRRSGTVVYEVEAAIKASKTVHLRADYSANANVIIEQANDIVKIPESVIEFNRNGTTSVYILTSNDASRQIFEQRQITLGLSDGNYVEVIEGLTLEDRLRGAQIN
jgi:HlyD family secretion protein